MTGKNGILEAESGSYDESATGADVVALVPSGPYGGEDDTAFLRRTLEEGKRALQHQRCFAGRLPEINRRELYLRKGCSSIFEFAARFGGMRKDHVMEVLRIDRRLHDYPKLRAMFHRGEQGWSKLRSVLSVVTRETETMWARHLTEKSKRELELLVAAIRENRCVEVDASGRLRGAATRQDDECDFLPSTTGVPTEARREQDNRVVLKFSPIVADLLLKKAKELTRREKRRVSYEDVVRRVLSGDGVLGDGRLDAKIVIHRQEPSGALHVRTAQGNVPVRDKDIFERYRICETVDITQCEPPPRVSSKHQSSNGRPAVPRALRRQVLEHRFGGRCGFVGCNRIAVDLHHQDRFSAHRVHDPARMVAVCRGHHGLTHQGHVLNEDEESHRWIITLDPKATGVRGRIDQLVKKYRRAVDDGGARKSGSS